MLTVCVTQVVMQNSRTSTTAHSHGATVLQKLFLSLVVLHKMLHKGVNDRSPFDGDTLFSLHFGQVALHNHLCSLHSSFALFSAAEPEPSYTAVLCHTSVKCVQNWAARDMSHNRCVIHRSAKWQFRHLAKQSENSAALCRGSEEMLWILTVCGLLVKMSRIGFWERLVQEISLSTKACGVIQLTTKMNYLVIELYKKYLYYYYELL